MMCIAIQRPFEHLIDELNQAFASDGNIKVVLNRRQGERRKTDQSVEMDKRGADRRKLKKEILEVTINI